MARNMHTNAMGLHHGCLVVDIDNQSWEQVAFAMNQSEGIGIGAVGQANVLTHIEG